MGIYDEARKIQEQEDNKFHKGVDVDISMADPAWLAEEISKPVVPFYIDLEYRSWGLKGIDVYFRDKITVLYAAVNQDTDEEQERELEVDLMQLRPEWVESNYYGPSDMYLKLNADGTVDYEHSNIMVCYIKQ